MVKECDCDRFPTVARTGAEQWSELGPEYEGWSMSGHDGVGMRMSRPRRADDASMNPVQREGGARARFSESAATDQEQEVQTGNECPPGIGCRGHLPEWVGSNTLLRAW